ncbi:hypothetical protein Csa_019646, partial [Cucumis sativus]
MLVDHIWSFHHLHHTIILIRMLAALKWLSLLLHRTSFHNLMLVALNWSFQPLHHTIILIRT